MNDDEITYVPRFKTLVVGTVVFIGLFVIIVLVLCGNIDENKKQIKELQAENNQLEEKIQKYEESGGILKPCPFCGSTDVELIEETYQVKCNNCLFVAPVLLDEFGRPDKNRNTKIDAINNWNAFIVNAD